MLKRLLKILATPLEIPRSTEFKFSLRKIIFSATENLVFSYWKYIFVQQKKGEAWQCPDKIGIRRKTLHSSPFGCIYKKNK